MKNIIYISRQAKRFMQSMQYHKFRKEKNLKLYRLKNLRESSYWKQAKKIQYMENSTWKTSNQASRTYRS